MKVNEFMAGLLLEIIQKEPRFGAMLFDEAYEPQQIVCDLIEIYKTTKDLDTRILITDFMLEAGYPCLRKLVTRDVSPIPAIFAAA